MSEEWIDAAFLRDVSRGSVDALDGLYRAYGPYLQALAMKITGSFQDGEDVIHDTFLDLPRAVGSFEGSGSFEAWLRQIVRRRSLMVLRTRRTRGEIELQGSTPSPGDPVHHATDRIAIHNALAALPDELRVIFVLHEVEGLTHQEIAESLGIRVGNSRTRLSRARERLRDLMNGKQ